MKKKSTRIIAGGLTFILLLSIAFVAFSATTSALEQKNITVTLYSGTDKARDNYRALDNAFKQANSSTMLNIKIAAKGNYYVYSGGGGALILHSNTMLDLNSSTIMRYGEMYNIFQNSDFNGNRDGTGYNQTYNFGIKNGTLDGSGGSDEEVNMVNFGHARNITIKDVKFKNCRNAHAIELAGCKDSLISGCTFDGFIGDGDGCNEAIQLDICNNNVAGSWNGIYKSDSSVCSGITVDKCTFRDYPSGVGNHHTVYGKHNTNITISNCKFLNSKTYAEIQPAIWCYGFDNSHVLNNEISGKYSEGILVSGGNVNVSGNTVTGVNYMPLYITVSNSYMIGKYRVTGEETATKCSVTDNTFSTTAAEPAVGIYHDSKITEFSGNTLSSTKDCGLYVTSSSVGTVTGNTIRNCGDSGIAVSSTGSVDTIYNNYISNCYEYGIRIYNRNITVAVGTNTFSGNGQNTLINANITQPVIVERTDLNTPVITSVSSVYGGVQVSWNRVSGASMYRVFYKNSKGGWSKLGDTTSTSMTDTVVTSGKTYTYTVRCITSDLSRYASSFDPAGKSVMYVAAPSATSVTCVSEGIKIEWGKSAGAAKYRVFRKNSSGWSKLGDTTSTSFTDTGVSSGATYTYTLRCLNAEGNYCSGYNGTGWKGTYVEIPVIYKATNTESGVKLYWNSVNGAAKYRAFYKNRNGGWTKLGDTTGTTLTDTVVSSGTEYVYTVRAINSSGSYAGDYEHNGYRHTFIQAPVFSVANAEDGVKISWSAVKGAAKYRIFYNTRNGWKKLTDTTATSVIDTDVRSGSAYTYTVRCLNADGTAYTSDYRAGKAVQFIMAPAFSVTNANNGVKISWNAVGGAAKYRVFYKNRNGGWSKLTDTASTSFIDTDVRSGVTYTYTVRCLNADASAYTSSFRDGKAIKYTPAG